MKDRYQKKDPVSILLLIILIVFVTAIIVIMTRSIWKTEVVAKTSCLKLFNFSYEILWI